MENFPGRDKERILTGDKEMILNKDKEKILTGDKEISGMGAAALRFLTDLVFPRRCPVCDRPVRNLEGITGGLICPECEPLLQRVAAPVCRRCGKPLRSARQDLCGDCRAGRHVYDRGSAVFTYHSAAGSIFRFKYGGRQEYGAYFGRCMARRLLETSRLFRELPDLLVPVPLSIRRMRKRGYNQAEILAREMARYTKIPVRTDVLWRVEDTLPMKNMDVRARQNNLKKAFHASGNDVELNSIMLIDDIYTTGATIDACAAALYRKGARRVCFMALAVGEDNHAEF